MALKRMFSKEEIEMVTKRLMLFNILIHWGSANDY